MARYFDYHYTGPAFDLFGPAHLTALAIIAAVITTLIAGRYDLSETAKQHARHGLIATILIVEIVYLYWLISNDAWDARINLPLHLCSFSVWGSVYVLATRSYRAYEIFFFLGIVGATQALITPSVPEYGLPHFRAIQTLMSHSLIVISMVYMTKIEGYRPTWRSVWRAFVAINLLVVPVTAVNLLIGSNYMFTLAKPASASLFDLLGPWPWYIFFTEFIALGLFSLLYVPIWITQMRNGTNATAKK